MNFKLLRQRLAVSTVVGTLVIMGNAIELYANEFDYNASVETGAILAQSYERIDLESIRDQELVDQARENFNRAFAEIPGSEYIRQFPNEDSEWLGKLYSGNVVTINNINQEWTQIVSGSVTGYVKTECLVIGNEAATRLHEVECKTGTVNVQTLNVRVGPSTDYERVAQVHAGQELMVEGEPVEGWYPIKLGNECYYVYGKYIDIETNYTFAESKEEEAERLAAEERARKEAEEAKRREEEARKRAEDIANGIIPEGTGAGAAVVEYAMQFIGNRYVWGGTSLTNGADCSGFVQSVYKHFGVSLPRTGSQQRGSGVGVSYADVQLGDIICYPNHVGIYMGDGKIVNAINSKKGIGILSATYTEIVTIRRVI